MAQLASRRYGAPGSCRGRYHTDRHPGATLQCTARRSDGPDAGGQHGAGNEKARFGTGRRLVCAPVYDTGWSDYDTLSAFLTYRRRRGDTHWVSSLVAVLRDARAATGRYVAAGEVSPRRQASGSWPGALGYSVQVVAHYA